MINSIIRAPFSIKIQPNMIEQEKKQQRIYGFLYLPYTKQRKKFTEKRAF